MDFAKLKEAFGTNRDAEAEGVWVSFNDHIRVKVRRSTNPIFRKALRKAFQRFKHMGSGITPEQEDIVKDQAVAKGLIVDWDIGGEPFSPEAALEAFKELPDFRAFCEAQGDDVDNFKGDVDGDKGNSSGSSTGSGNGDHPQP